MSNSEKWKRMLAAGGSMAAGLSLLMGAGRKPADAKPVEPVFSSWLTYWDSGRARIGLNLAAAQLKEVDLFAYHFTEEDALVPAGPDLPILQSAIQQMTVTPKPRFAITIVNDVASFQGIRLKDPACVHRALSTPAARQAHIQKILAIAADAESIDIDYERVAAEDGPAFSAFIQSLAGELHQRGKRLSVVVEPRIAGQNNPLPWNEIAQAADQLTIMAYLYHYGSSAPGSIAPTDWIRDIAKYALTQAPADKICMALHLGGIDWPKEGLGKSIEYDKANALAAAYGKVIELDRETQSGHFTYSDGTGPHQVWIETAAGLRVKVEAILELGISKIAFWRLGSGDPAFWDRIAQKR